QDGVEVVSLAKVVAKPEQIRSKHSPDHQARPCHESDRAGEERDLPDRLHHLEDIFAEDGNAEPVEQPDGLEECWRHRTPAAEVVRQVEQRETEKEETAGDAKIRGCRRLEPETLPRRSE